MGILLRFFFFEGNTQACNFQLIELHTSIYKHIICFVKLQVESPYKDPDGVRDLVCHTSAAAIMRGRLLDEESSIEFKASWRLKPLPFVPEEYLPAHTIVSQDQERLNRLNNKKRMREGRVNPKIQTMRLHYFCGQKEKAQKKV